MISARLIIIDSPEAAPACLTHCDCVGATHFAGDWQIHAETRLKSLLEGF